MLVILTRIVGELPTEAFTLPVLELKAGQDANVRNGNTVFYRHGSATLK